MADGDVAGQINLRVVIASPLEAEHVDQLRDALKKIAP